jgi:hypothetical protein
MRTETQAPAKIGDLYRVEAKPSSSAVRGWSLAVDDLFTDDPTPEANGA